MKINKLKLRNYFIILIKIIKLIIKREILFWVARKRVKQIQFWRQQIFYWKEVVCGVEHHQDMIQVLL